MLPAVKKIIEQHKELIEREDWKALYQQIAKTNSAPTIGALSQNLTRCWN